MEDLEQEAAEEVHTAIEDLRQARIEIRSDKKPKKEKERAEESEMAFISKCKESMGEKPREDEIVYWNCVGCGHFQRKEMKKCPSCDWAIYCSEECFAEHWPVHQEICQNVEN